MTLCCRRAPWFGRWRSERFPSLSYHRIIRALQRDGWTVVRQRGSHIRLQKRVGDETLKVTVSAHLRRVSGRNRALLRLAAAAIALAASNANASCIEQSLKHYRKRADVIFRGKILRIEDLGEFVARPDLPPQFRIKVRRFIVTFDVSRVWKGEVGRTVRVYGTCGGLGDDAVVPYCGSEPHYDWVIFGRRPTASEMKPESTWGFLGLSPDQRILTTGTSCVGTFALDYPQGTYEKERIDRDIAKKLRRLGTGRPPLRD